MRRFNLLLLFVVLLTTSSALAQREWGESSGTQNMFGGEERPWGEDRPEFGSPEMVEQLRRQVQSGMPSEEGKFIAGDLSADEKAVMVKIGINGDPRQQIGEFINNLPKGNGYTSLKDGTLSFVKTAELEKLFPEWMFYVARFPKYPANRLPPEGLTNSNIFIIKKTGRMALIASTDELQAFFTSTLSAESDVRARLLVYAWLQLATEIIQDGLYKFAIVDDGISVSTRDAEMIANGKASVDKSTGKGDVFVTMIFDAGGKLRAVEEKNTVQPGFRPL